jgi:hypothetical protein
MTLKEINSLPIGQLIKLEYIPNVGVLLGETEQSWVIGIPYFFNEQWIIEILASIYPNLHSLKIIHEKDIITPISSQDIVKYINNLTEAGTEYLKNLKL